MSMALRYRGGFYSYNNVLYDIEIWQEGFSGSFTSVAFSNPPLEIQWNEIDKIDPVQTSCATLELYSDTDGQFTDLYSIAACSVRMDVYRAGQLYWSGTLDSEIYEEPFSYKDNYGVKLTFSDMSVLERLKWESTGFMTLRELIIYALQKCGISYSSIEEHTSTKLTSVATSSILDDVSIQTDNFYDEDGEALSYRKVIEGVLKPLSLHVCQKNGKIIIYDLNSLYTAFTQETIGWSSDDATLGSDKVYNNVKVTFSPYERQTILDADDVQLDESGTTTTVTTGVSTESSSEEIGFQTKFGDSGSGIIKNASAKFFKIIPVYSGDENKGIAWTLRTFPPGGSYQHYINSATSSTNALLFKLSKLGYLSDPGTSRTNFRLRVNLQLLADVRYNPFENADSDNEKGNYEEMKNRCNFVYIPFILTLRDSAGTALYHWENNAVKASTSFARVGCKWISGEGSWGCSWLTWYSGDRKTETGIGGWQSNKQIIGYYRGKTLPFTFDKADPGEYIDMPATSGYLELQIGTGILMYDYGGDTPILRNDMYSEINWLLYKEPSVKIVDKYYNEIDSKDVEIKAWINRDAKESLTIDTIQGTLENSSPTALGQYFHSSDKTAINSFYRGGFTDRIEHLLIGSIYSNYASRHIILSGTADLLTEFGTYKINNHTGVFMLLSETQHLRDDESEISAVQFEQDNYQGASYE